MAATVAALVACSDDAPKGGSPALSSVPGTSPGGIAPAQRRQMVAALIADRDNARYTDEQLRAGPPDLPPPTPRVAAAPRPELQTAPPAVPQVPVGVAPIAPPLGPVAAVPTTQAPAQVAPAPMPGQPSDILSEVFRRALAQSGGAAPAAYVPPAPMAAPQVVPIAAAVAPPVAPPPAVPVAAGSSEVFAQVFQRALAQSTSGANAPTVGMTTVAAAPMPAPPIVPPVQPTAVAGFMPGQPTAIRFGENSNRLTNEHRTQIAATAEQWRSRRGTIRVIAQSSDGAATRPGDQMLASFRIASERAEAVAAELRRLGIPANMIHVESRTGALPGGQAARQVEIFLL